MAVVGQFATVDFNHGETFYCCLINRIQLSENRKIEVYGSHKYGNTNNDVVHIKFNNCIVTKIPQELTIIFPNLKNLVIINSNLKKICKNDLIEYRNLEFISFADNEFEFLPGDLFQNFQHLSFINFKRNKLTLIEPNILNGLGALKFVNFSENPRYEKFFSIFPVHNSNATLEEVKNELYDKFYSRFDFLQDLKRSEEQLKLENIELKNKIEEIISSNLTKDISEDFKNSINDENSKDLKILIDDRVFMAHKFLLIIRSPTLAEILQNNPEVESLNLIDISVDIFKIIMKFLYTDELPEQNGTNFLQLFAAAGRLKIKKLTNRAAERLLNLVNSENALEILNLSNKFQYPKLRKKAFRKLKEKYPKVRDEWLENQEKLNNVIEMFKEKEEAIRKFEEKFEKILQL